MKESAHIKLLFVDDDPSALDHLRLALAEKHRHWDMRFVTSGEAALAELEFRGPADVIVTDLRMPLMDGAALLAAVRARHPRTIRIVTSDFHDLPSALRSIPAAHQFLSSPVDVDQLTNAVERTVGLQRRLDHPGLHDLVAGIDVLPSPPLVVVELNRVLDSPTSTVDDVARIISDDPAMTAKLLQLVNSAFFGLNHRITNVQHAISYLGLATVRNLLSAVELVRAFMSPNVELLRSVEEIHTHSLTVAELARSFMGHRHLVHETFAAGMMHEVGLLAVISHLPERYVALRNEMSGSGRTMEECEIDILGAHHAHLGAHLLDLWGLPYALVEAVAHSHDADQLPDRTLNPAHAVFVAEQVVNMAGGTGASEGGRLPDADYLNDLGLFEIVTRMVGRSRA